MNIGRLITGSDDKGYDPDSWLEIAIAAEACEAEEWLEQLNNDAASHNESRPGIAARAVLRSSARIVRGNHGV